MKRFDIIKISREVLLSVSGIFILIALVLYISIFFNILSIEPSILNSSIVMVLLFVTFLYTNYTAQIVEETKKDRNVAFIERRLEKLYFPLKICLIQHSKIKLSTFNVDDLFSIRKSLDNIIPYLYLSSNDLRGNLESFLEIIGIDFTKILEKLQKEMTDNRIESAELNNPPINEIKPCDVADHIKKIEHNARNFNVLIDERTKKNTNKSYPNDVVQENIEKNQLELISLYNKILKNIDEDISEYESHLKELIS